MPQVQSVFVVLLILSDHLGVALVLERVEDRLRHFHPLLLVIGILRRGCSLDIVNSAAGIRLAPAVLRSFSASAH